MGCTESRDFEEEKFNWGKLFDFNIQVKINRKQQHKTKREVLQ
jgi:hypothetical protein